MVTSRSARPSARLRPWVEILEDRILPSASQLLFLGPEVVRQGDQVRVGVVALGSAGRPARAYAGTVRFTSTDPADTLPGDYTFRPGDRGRHVFTVTPGAAGRDTILAADTVAPSVAGSITLAVAPPAVATRLLIVAPRRALAGRPVPLEVFALDAADRPVRSYAGTVRFTSTAAGDTLPGDYTFVPADRGRHLYRVTPGRAGRDTITVTDTADGPVTGDVTLDVHALGARRHRRERGMRLRGWLRHLRQVVSALRGALQRWRHRRAGRLVPVVVIALGASGRPARDFAGTVHFTSTGQDDTLPANYTFRPGDRGRHIFLVRIASPGTDTITATDTTDQAVTGSVVVEPRVGRARDLLQGHGKRRHGRRDHPTQTAPTGQVGQVERAGGP